MRKAITFFLIILTIMSCSSKKHSFSNEDMTVLQDNIYIKYDSVWQSERAEIDKAINFSIEYLNFKLNNNEDTINNDIEKILNEINEYRIQVIPLIDEDNKYIWLNFTYKDHNYKNWKDHMDIV